MLDNFGNQTLISLNVTDCMVAYGKEFVSTYGNLLLVYERESDYSLVLAQYANSPALGSRSLWMCDIPTGLHEKCDFANLIRKNATSWKPFVDFDSLNEIESLLEGNIKYCLAKKLDSSCRLDISLPIMVIVLVCNVIKFGCFIMTLLVDGSMYSLVINGDVVQSFLLRSNISLQSRCLISKRNVKHKHFWLGQSLPCSWRSKRRS